jgi:hypothetical protein
VFSRLCSVTSRHDYSEQSEQRPSDTAQLLWTGSITVDSVTRSIHENKEFCGHTWCMQRLREKEIKRGDGAHVSLRGNQRHIATQLTTWAMSKAGLHTLLEMLGEEGYGTKTKTKTKTYHFQCTRLTVRNCVLHLHARIWISFYGVMRSTKRVQVMTTHVCSAITLLNVHNLYRSLIWNKKLVLYFY